jgi:hypothetical protein
LGNPTGSSAPASDTALTAGNGVSITPSTGPNALTIASSSQITNPAGSQTLTAAQWIACSGLVAESASQTYTLPVYSTTVSGSPNGCYWIQTQGVTATLTPNSGDAIKIGSAAGVASQSVTIPADVPNVIITSDGAGWVCGGCIPLTGQLIAPVAGNYTITAANKGAILDCSANNQAGPNPTVVTYTMPTSGTTVFPAGSRVTIKNFSTSTTTAIAICKIATTSGAIVGARGVIGGNPAIPNTCSAGIPLTLYPGGEVILQSDSGGCYRAFRFDPGVWTQNGAGMAAIVYTQLSGYLQYDVDCNGLIPTVDNYNFKGQLAYGGIFQTSAYHYVLSDPTEGSSAVTAGTVPLWATAQGTGDTIIMLTGTNATGQSFSTGSNVDGATVHLHVAMTYSSGAGFLTTVTGFATAHLSGGFIERKGIGAVGPYSNSANLSGMQFYYTSSGGAAAGMCSLKPSL